MSSRIYFIFLFSVACGSDLKTWNFIFLIFFIIYYWHNFSVNVKYFLWGRDFSQLANHIEIWKFHQVTTPRCGEARFFGNLLPHKKFKIPPQGRYIGRWIFLAIPYHKEFWISPAYHIFFIFLILPNLLNIFKFLSF